MKSLLLLFALAITINPAWSQSTIGKKCKTSEQCQDGIYCNGAEICAPDTDGKNRCKAAVRPRCLEAGGMRCVEASKSCEKIMCDNQNDCNDGLFCTGNRSCNPARYANNFDLRMKNWGCSPAKNPCEDGMTCDEARNACYDPNCVGRLGDNDGDGHKSIACKGDDCDDNDPNRFPGNPEVCDFEGHDEDCDETTLGRKDEDKDGYVSNRCCQIKEDGEKVCGPDCNDQKAIIIPGSQMCVKHGYPVVNICGEAADECAKGLVCYNQPNGLGVCGPKFQ